MTVFDVENVARMQQMLRRKANSRGGKNSSAYIG
jgi:hypothetical protein